MLFSRKLKEIFSISVLFIVPLSLLQCTKGKSDSTETIQIKGSDTMVNLVQAWAEEYKNVNPSVDIEVSGGGSGVGIAALERGSIDIATASRNIKPKEAAQVKANTKKDPVEYIVGYDALAVYVHKDNPINEIALEQLADIFAENGRTTTWSQLGVVIPGAKSDKIIRISRQSSSGTYEFFRTVVLNKKDFKLGSMDMNGSKEVVELISATRTAIGYSGMGYATDHVKMLRIIKKTGGIPIEPSAENTLNKSYPLARSLQIYTVGEPSGSTKTFIDWVFSDVGQRLVLDNGYIPIRLN